MTKRAPEPRIGTSGWNYKHWVGRYYPDKTSAAKMLARYIEDFDTVELNNSFYKLPKPETMRAWRGAVPETFVFALKASRYITHNLKLKNPQNALDKFLPIAEMLDKKLGPILFQLPPKCKVNVERLDEFLSLMPRHHRYAFELREPSWMCAPAYDVLRKYNAALCIFEIAGYHAPLELTADWTYVRLHGPGGKYQGNYSDPRLQQWARQLRKWRGSGVASYLYFDNDEAGYAAKNALHLKQLLTVCK
ncbi:MAG: DUF72 domain-containing protein [Acidobacteriaceae bacterium]